MLRREFSHSQLCVASYRRCRLEVKDGPRGKLRTAGSGKGTVPLEGQSP
jgi:hypothetical protein